MTIDPKAVEAVAHVINPCHMLVACGAVPLNEPKHEAERKERAALKRAERAIQAYHEHLAEQGLVIQQGWRPVADAPSDIPVLLYCPSAGCESNPERIEFEIYRSTRGGFRHAWATMWQPAPLLPIPAPPAEQGGGND